jgi:hypothetical protein
MVSRMPTVPTVVENETEAGEFSVWPSSDTTMVSVLLEHTAPENAASSQSSVVIWARPGNTGEWELRISSRLRMSPGSQVYVSR